MNKKYVIQLHASVTGAVTITIVNDNNQSKINDLIDECVIEGCYCFIKDTMPAITNDKMNPNGDNTVIYNPITNEGKILAGNHILDKNENCIIDYHNNGVSIVVINDFKTKIKEYSESEIFEILKSIIENKDLNYDVKNISLDTYIYKEDCENSFEWDLLDEITFIMEVEDRFKIDLTDDNISDEYPIGQQVADIVKFIKEYIKQHNETTRTS